jgi:hypothetical protein
MQIRLTSVVLVLLLTLPFAVRAQAPPPANPVPDSPAPDPKAAVPEVIKPPAPTVAKPPAPVQTLPISEAAGILGRTVRGEDGKDLGRIIDVIVDQNGQPRAAVIDFGGFLGLGARKIAVDWSTLHFAPGNHDVPVTLDLTPDQIKAAPEYKERGQTPTAIVTPAIVIPAPAPPPAPQPTPSGASEDKAGKP